MNQLLLLTLLLAQTRSVDADTNATEMFPTDSRRWSQVADAVVLTDLSLGDVFMAMFARTRIAGAPTLWRA